MGGDVSAARPAVLPRLARGCAAAALQAPAPALRAAATSRAAAGRGDSDPCAAGQQLRARRAPPGHAKLGEGEPVQEGDHAEVGVPPQAGDCEWAAGTSRAGLASAGTAGSVRAPPAPRARTCSHRPSPQCSARGYATPAGQPRRSLMLPMLMFAPVRADMEKGARLPPLPLPPPPPPPPLPLRLMRSGMVSEKSTVGRLQGLVALPWLPGERWLERQMPRNAGMETCAGRPAMRGRQGAPTSSCGVDAGAGAQAARARPPGAEGWRPAGARALRLLQQPRLPACLPAGALPPGGPRP